MYYIDQFTGATMPHKTICLTYDDGPGEYSHDIAAFLAGYGIRATFFVVGKYAIHHEDTLEAMHGMGHIIANHTYEHPDLPYYVSVGGDIQNQVLRTDAIIKKYTKHTVFFRCPYGKWSAEAANELNLNIPAALNHIGPIYWDIDGIDCYYWKLGKTVDDAIAAYLARIDEKGKGIMVMHDDIADMDDVKPLNKTLELTRRLIPILLEKGYTFIGLDEVPGIAARVAEPVVLSLRSANGRYLSLQGSVFTAKSKTLTPAAHLLAEDKGYGKWAIKTADDLYLTITNAHTGQLEATAVATGTQELFDVVPVRDNRLMLRCATGNYLTIDKRTKTPVATAQFMRQAGIFTCTATNLPAVKKRTLKEQLDLLLRLVRFVKSKIIKG